MGVEAIVEFLLVACSIWMIHETFHPVGEDDFSKKGRDASAS